MDIQELLKVTTEREASDLHLISAYCPAIRVHGELHQLVTYPLLTPLDIEQMVFSLITPAQKELLITNKELDFSTTYRVSDTDEVRFRVNAYFQKATLAVSFRYIPSRIKTIEELRLPLLLREFTKLRQGFVLLTGPTGQGKSTTIASLLQEINTLHTAHIISIEDPIEYVFARDKSIFSQREMNLDTYSWKNALKYALREDPDIVYVGEMRDLEAIAAALTIAETGHLLFSTLHTNSASQSIDRIIDVFPSHQQAQVRMQLSMVISGIVSQKLVPTVAGDRIPVCEIMMGTNAVKSAIRDGKTFMLDNIIQTSADAGMMLFEEHLRQHVEHNIVSHETALQYAIRPEMYLELMQR